MISGLASQWTLLIIFLASISSAGQDSVPKLLIEAADSMSAAANQIRLVNERRLTSVMRLTGLDDPGEAIRILLIPEESTIAKETSSWIAGYVDQQTNIVVLFPQRIGSYPWNSLEKTLYHEISHVLTNRAAGNMPVPRWFNEGLASAAESSWGIEARTRSEWEILITKQLTETELDGLFTQGPREITRAYALADALVRDLLIIYGPLTPAKILDRMTEGQTFDQAIYDTTGDSVEEIIENFWKRHRIWESWIGIIGNPFTLWTFITTLALIAIWRHRKRRIQRRLQWELEERAEQQEWEEHRKRYRIH
jgi:hypothetical protein